MGREVRRVPPNWKHPVYTTDDTSDPGKLGQYKSLYDQDSESRWAEWLADFEEFKKGKHERIEKEYGGYPLDEPYRSFCSWHGHPPDPELCRPKFTEEPTWFQVYETVSEGSPVTPPFATLEEVAKYISTEGDFGYQEGIKRGWRDERKPTYEQALAMVKRGWASSMVVTSNGSNIRIEGPYEQS